MKASPRTLFNVALVIFAGVLIFLGFDDNDSIPPQVDSTALMDSANTAPVFEPMQFEKIRTAKPGSVQNIILMVGDGMGLAQITAGFYGDGKSSPLERIKIVGLMTTHSATSILTDSAAGATTFATGRKTRSGMISMTPDTVAVKTIFEYAEDQGLSTGLVVTSTITHATPASFFGHQPKRNSVNERLVAQLYEADVEVIMGGGSTYFNNRADNRNMFEEFEAKGYVFADSIEATEGEEYNKLVCLISPEQPIGITEGRKPGFLPQGTKKALETLERNPNGFFLLVEGSQIDWGGHNNDSEYIVEEMKEFHDAIEVALDYAAKDGNTLVIILADHETGGYAINDGIMKDKVIRGAFTTDYHTASMVPVFAYGPGQESFGGMLDNIDIFYKMMALLGFSEGKEAAQQSEDNGKSVGTALD